MKNMGLVDKIIRFILGAALLWSGYAYLQGALAIVAYVVGIVFLATTLLSSCPLYKAIGINTCKTCGQSKTDDKSDETPTTDDHSHGEAEQDNINNPEMAEPQKEDGENKTV